MADINASLNGIRAYYSHSYRPEDKQINLFFWELFSQYDCYFTVHQKPEDEVPMDVTYLEWLMGNSDYFVAVIPKRFDQNSPDGCSPYQAFELALAKRSGKPSIVFAETGLQDDLFRGFGFDEVCFFSRSTYAGMKSEFSEKVKVLLAKARTRLVSKPRSRKKIAILAEGDSVYTQELEEAIRVTARQHNFILDKTIHPARDFEDEVHFIADILNYEILISETRWPYIPLDLFAIPHAWCIPTIPICYLNEGETEEQVTQQMKLGDKKNQWKDDKRGFTVNLFKKYQLDKDMRPVLFWSDINDLLNNLSDRLDMMDQAIGRSELRTLAQAKEYFLKIGRQQAKVFISNSSSVNLFARKLAEKFKDEAIDRFHYMDFEAIPVGTEDWWEKVRTAIDESKIFVVLMNEKFFESEWCKKELDYAISRFKKGKIEIHPYLMEKMKYPTNLGFISGKTLPEYPKKIWIDLILQAIVEYIEKPIQWRLPRDFTQISISLQDHHLGIIAPNEDTKKEWEKKSDLQENLLNFVRKAGMHEDIWGEAIDLAGDMLLENFFDVPEIQTKYEETLKAVDNEDEKVRFCFATDKDAFRIPFEWTKVGKGDSDLLCFRHPVYRKLSKIPKSNFRPTLNQVGKKQLKILLVASDTGGIPDVEKEVNALEKFFIEECKLPRENICKLRTAQATKAKIQTEIQTGKYHILHFAGHGSREDDEQVNIKVCNSTGGKALISPSEISAWISNSDLRFVYLSNCLSADMIGSTRRSAIPRKYKQTLDLVEAVVNAKVPEVIGFHSPIIDSESCEMAITFYQHLFKNFDSDFTGFDAAFALYKVRNRFAEQGAKIWAAPLLIQQL